MTAKTGLLPFEIAPIAHAIAGVVELLGIAIIVLGMLAATIAVCVKRRELGTFDKTYQAYRSYVGRAILLGLEFLVAADIIGTVAVEPTFQNLGVLALIVVIRTFLSYSLEVEIDGKWPWQQDKDHDKV